MWRFSIADEDGSENVTFKVSSNFVAFIPIRWKCQMYIGEFSRGWFLGELNNNLWAQLIWTLGP